MRRLFLLLLMLLGVAAFLVVSALLARALTVGGAEDSALTTLARDEARGKRAAVIADVVGCRHSAACRARAAVNVAALKHSGNVQIAEINPSAGFSLTATTGTARLAWIVGASFPRVQCVRVRRAGNVLSGYRIQLLKVSVRIRSSADCPASY
jgi:hypothetical protein